MSLTGFRYTWDEIRDTPTIMYTQYLMYTLERLSIVRNYSAPVTTKSYIALKAAEILDEKHNTSIFIVAETVN